MIYIVKQVDLDEMDFEYVETLLCYFESRSSAKRYIDKKSKKDKKYISEMCNLPFPFYEIVKVKSSKEIKQ